MTTFDHLYRNLGLGFLVLGLSGCVFLPVPIPASLDDPVEARRDSIRQSAESFQPGKTTRRDVLLTLGEPGAVSFDECKLIYWSPKSILYLPDGSQHRDMDYLVAEFDTDGVLVNFEEMEHCPELVPQISRYDGHKVLLQRGADMIKVTRWAQDEFRRGTVILTEAELVFISNKPIANTPDLRMAYSSIAEVRQQKFPRRLKIRSLEGAEYKFVMLNNQWWVWILDPFSVGDIDETQEVYELIHSRLTPGLY